MGQGDATAITPQGRRTPTGLPSRNPATSPPTPSQRDLGVGNPEQPRALGATEPQAPRAQT